MKKEISRQRRWQMKNFAAGKCHTCSDPLATARFCLKHAVMQRELTRKKNGPKRRNNSLTYRLEKEMAK